MKRILISIATLLLLILIFFTMFGEKIYEYMTPNVEVMAVNASITIDDTDYLLIPKTALTEDNCVYIVSSEQGFSRMIYTIQKKSVSFIELPDYDENLVYVVSGITKGARIISQLDHSLSLQDGDRVIVD